ncbi:MAG: PLP-dependent transferase [Lachnospiraceae bacterium]|nr:PLP-dependent transferase [Lachnospiraceae bacterium]
MTAGKSLYQALSDYAASDFYPCHMPGHKRNSAGGEMADYYKIDITEIDGFDNLHQAEGILKEAQLRANRLYGADETFFLVNGSTCGVLAAIMAAALPFDEILLARNCHKSVYHAAILQGLIARYYYPKIISEYDICDGVSAEEIGSLLDTYPEVKAVVITSPTYEGVISDIPGIADVVHERGKILVVDEAHGSHFGLSPHLPQGAIAGGADLVIHSLHKTLPSMTQTAILHVNGDRVDRKKLRGYLSMLQSSSPSYVLMASMDACMKFLEEQGQERFAAMRGHYESFCEKTASLAHIHVGKMKKVSQKRHELKDWDLGKLVISVKGTGMTGKELGDILRETYHLEMEMAAETYVLAIMTLMDEVAGWQRLADALCEIDGRIEEGADDGCFASGKRASYFSGPLNSRMTLARAFHSQWERMPLKKATGRIAADFISLYPPGSPIVAPGEILDEAVTKRIEEYRRTGLNIQGVSEQDEIVVVAL